MRAIIARAMQNADEWVISLDYTDSHGVCTRRIVSPIRFVSGNSFLALCLCREEPRRFAMDRCHNIKLCRAEEFVMPVPVMTLATSVMPELAACV